MSAVLNMAPHTERAWRDAHPAFTPAEVLVLLVLAREADRVQGARFEISQTEISEMARVSIRTVGSALSILEKSGYIRRGMVFDSATGKRLASWTEMVSA